MILPRYRVKSNQVIELTRGNPFEWIYSENTALDFGTAVYLTFTNSYGQTLDVWEADTIDGVATFYELPSASNAIPAGTGWTISVDYNDGNPPRIREQGTVIRAEAPWPNAPATSDIFAGVQYAYPFGSVGYVTDPAWRIMAGRPYVYDNSGDSEPNAVACGVNDVGAYEDVSMFYYAPLKTDSVRFTYNTVPGGNGDACVIICSNYDATNWAAIRHHKGGGDYLSIVRGSAPTTLTNVTSTVSRTFAYETFTAEYNPTSNTFSVYVGTDTTPLVSWVDSSNTVQHGNADRYVGLYFKSSAAAPGPEIAQWRASDNIGV